MYEEHDDSSWSFAIGLFIGATLGAALASLFSPRSGPQNREAVREQGLVLKSRVSNATTTAATTVKDRTDVVVARINDTATTVKEKTNSAIDTVSETVSSAATTVKETANSTIETVKEKASSAVETVSETASTAAARVQDAAATAKEKVTETAATVKEKASSAVETVSETASTAATKVQDVASSAAARVQDVASTATEKARTLTQGTGTSANDEIVVTTVGELAHQASYDAEDARPVATVDTETTPPAAASGQDTATSELAADIANVNPNQASSDRPIDTTSGLADPQIIEVDLLDTAGDGTLIEEPTDPEVAELDLLDASSDGQSDVTAAELTDTLTADAAMTEALADLSSAEQFEVDSSTAAGTDADVREASEGADRGSA